nr:polyprotein [Citrus endogenous pararetrovirus]
MASTSSSNLSTPLTLSSTLSLPKSCTSHTANKIENLVEYSYIPESAQISESSYPLLSPYHLYKRPSSFTRSIRTLISTRRPHPKEYIQSSCLDQCSLQATPAEQYVTLEIPSELISNWKREGYTHLHLGGIRLILTLHGRKGLPVTARLAMLDTRFKQYQDAVIGTVLTTLHAGSVLLTFYPNFNLSLQDPNLPTTLKVQVQIQGAEQIPSAKIATLHYQLVYRLQNHALDLPTPEHHSDTLMVLAEFDQIPTIIQIPRQIPRHELIKLMPLEWISNYEQFHNNTAPIQTSESMFERRQDGTVRMTFKPPPSAPQEPPRLSFTYSSMITAVQTAQEDLPITGFNSEGYPVYPAKHNGHFLWDAPGSGMCDPTCPCWDDWEEEDDYVPRRKRKPKRKKPPVSCHHYDPKPPQDPPSPPAPLPYYQKELQWIAKHCRSETPSPIPLPTPPLTCMMFSSTSSDYSSSFPPLERHTDSHRNVVSKPFIPSPTLFTTSPPIPSIGPTYHPFASMLSPIRQYDPSKLFCMTHTLFRDNPLTPPPKPKPKLRPQPRPVTFHIPGQHSPGHTPASPPVPSPPTESQPPSQSKDKQLMHQFSAHTVDHSSTTADQTSDSNLVVSDSHTGTDTESSVSTSDSEKSYADITIILMAQPDQPRPGQTSHTEPYVDIPSEVKEEMSESSATNQPPPAQAHTSSPNQKSSNGPWFTFDDLPSYKWRDRLNEMSAWIDLQMLRSGATTESVLREFATRFTGALRDWFDSLGPYRQLQFVQLPEVSSALAILHDQFLGDPAAAFEAARRDYLSMKCCSLDAKDLDFHYKRMSLLFYKLNGFNEPTLKHVFLASLPEELQPDIQRQLTASNLVIDNISLGKIFQLAKTCLDKLCEQKQFFKDLLKDKEPFRSACKKPYLQIKCKQKKDCDCSPKKKRHFRKFKSPEFSSRPRRSRKPYRFFRKRSSSSKDSKRRKSSRCFICRKKGHFAKDCPNKRAKSIRLVEHLQATTDYSPQQDELEFYFSEQDEPNDETVFALQQSSDDSDSDQSQVIFHQQLLSLDTTVPIPSIKLQILPSKFQRPIPAIGLIDTGAQRSMINPHILPPDSWTQSEEHFKAVNGKLFTTSLITKKPIGIQIFPNCVIWTKVIGSTLPNKDILLGFDILHQIKHLQIIPHGIRVKSMFKPFTDVLKLYNLSETPPSYQDVSTKLLSFCPESHSEFTHPNPLWKNQSFFVKLPFKLNEDINPTKATHPGMSPSDLLLAQQECSQLLAQGLIEPTTSQWACQAFYVEKHSEIVRGKKRLVIDYQPLNMFLQDDKFPLPRRQSMFTFLKNAQIFSKFDLKSGFWQLGIEPSERYKTAFCIPNAHFQWTVLPFGLKTAPSIFQKSMIKIFQPLLSNALIYIDDILLFSGSHDDHHRLLNQFYDIVHSHGIMLSAKKSTIATDTIEFLGMIIKDGHYQPGKHVAQELLHFPDQQLSKKQVQQFLGIINYIRDFIPHVDHYTRHLSALLKKKPPEWNDDHTNAVTTLKKIAQNPPPKHQTHPTKKILQTDASDQYWSAVLLEEHNGKRHFCAHASGQFKHSEKNYHVIYKEILTVKYGIKKFEFHLISHTFLINMDNSSFPRIFDFKNKLLLDKQLLNLKTWFAKYDFTVQHIKGNQNLIPDFLTRPAINKPSLISSIQTIPVIALNRQLPFKALTQRHFPMNISFQSAYQLQDFTKKFL